MSEADDDFASVVTRSGPYFADKLARVEAERDALKAQLELAGPGTVYVARSDWDAMKADNERLRAELKRDPVRERYEGAQDYCTRLERLNLKVEAERDALKAANFALDNRLGWTQLALEVVQDQRDALREAAELVCNNDALADARLYVACVDRQALEAVRAVLAKLPPKVTPNG